MGLLDEFRATQRVLARNGKVCSMERIAAALSDDERAELEDALRLDSGIRHTTIARVLTERGHKVSDGTVAYHRNRRCSCDGPR